MNTAKTLIRLGGSSGRSEFSPGAHVFFCFCHAPAYLYKIMKTALVEPKHDKDSNQPA